MSFGDAPDGSGCFSFMLCVLAFAILVFAFRACDEHEAGTARERARFFADCKAHGKAEYECTALWGKLR